MVVVFATLKQALFLQDGLKLDSVHLVPDPGMSGWGISTASWGFRVEGASGNGKGPNFGATETQVTCETASKFCHLSELPHLQKEILKQILHLICKRNRMDIYLPRVTLILQGGKAERSLRWKILSAMVGLGW